MQRETAMIPVILKRFLCNKRGEMIQLDNIISVVERSSPPQLASLHRYRSATISAGGTRKTIADGIAAMNDCKGCAWRQFQHCAYMAHRAIMLKAHRIFCLRLFWQLSSFIPAFRPSLKVSLSLSLFCLLCHWPCSGLCSHYGILIKRLIFLVRSVWLCWLVW